MTASLRLRPAKSENRRYVERLLSENELPTADLSESLNALYVCEVDDEQGSVESERVGIGGVEVHGEYGLLRSVVVEERVRGEGYGRALCDRLLDQAADAGVETVYLLTTTADEFFSSLGFVAVERESVPPAIRDTAEFSELCPDSAVCMRKEIER